MKVHTYDPNKVQNDGRKFRSNRMDSFREKKSKNDFRHTGAPLGVE